MQEIPLTQGRIIVGRTPDNDLQIDSRFVSRHHCQITTSANSCVIEDLNSTNGIYVKSRRVRRHYLNDGDVVLIGKHELIYVDERLGPHAQQPQRHRTRHSGAAARRWSREHGGRKDGAKKRRKRSGSRRRGISPDPVAGQIRLAVLGAQVAVVAAPEQHHHAAEEGGQPGEAYEQAHGVGIPDEITAAQGGEAAPM